MTLPPRAKWQTLAMKTLRFALLVGVWLVVSLVISMQMYVASRVNGAPQPWLQAFATTVPWYMAWAMLTPAVVWVARRFDVHRQQVMRTVAIHAAAALVVAVCHGLIYVAIVSWLNRDNPAFPDGAKLLAIKLSGSLHINMMIYAIIAGLVIGGRAYARLRDREVAAVRLEAQLAEAETAVLRAQMQPHFLFNTLNAISALVREDPSRATRLIARLGDLLRQSLQHRGQFCSLADELEFTDTYLAIEQERLGERLKIVRSIDPEALALQVPALLLQPLAENAIRHGFAPRVQGGTLKLTAELTSTRLRLTVADDGLGASDVTEGIGIGNTRTRLRQLYGDSQSLTIRTAPDGGFSVTIEVPGEIPR